MGTLLTRHVAHQLQVSSGVGIDHHGPFDGDISDTEGERGVAEVETGFGVFEEGACSGEGVVSGRTEEPVLVGGS
jgi:hypothetical protein